MKYILVENGEIKTSPLQLPKNWKNVSNFYLLDNVALKEYGWYPHRFVQAQIQNNQVYDGSTFMIEQDEVVEYQQVRNKTQQEINQDTEDKWNSIRNQRNTLLYDCDWTQLPDSPLTNEKKQEWATYRQALRDITLQVNPDNIIWPTKPI